jgi:hypothetical protein
MLGGQKRKVARALEKMAQRTPGVTTPPAEPSDGGQLLQAGGTKRRMGEGRTVPSAIALSYTMPVLGV